MAHASRTRAYTIVSCLCLGWALALTGCQAPSVARAGQRLLPVFVAYGHVFEIDLARRRLIPHGVLDVTAPAVARSADGAVWGRSSARAVGPARVAMGDDAPSVALPDAPYLVVHDGSQTLYVTHTTVRSGTATVSIVDTVRGVTRAAALHVPGPATDIALATQAVYVASLPVDAGGVPRLTRFAVRESPPNPNQYGRVVLDGLDAGSQFRLAVRGDQVFVSGVTGRSIVSPMVLRLHEDRVAATVRLDAYGPVTHVVGRPYVAHDRVLVPVLLSGDRSAVAELTTGDLALVDLYHVDHPVSEVLAADDDTIACVDSLATAGREGLHLSFLDRASGKEVTRIRVTDLL